ncbi:MAG: hypothetical protein K0S55_2055 [Clostridia bacterium]|nr:hypothetical protein [Clostridia bacterium]
MFIHQTTIGVLSVFNLSLTACSFHIRQFNSKSVEKIFKLNDKFEISEEIAFQNAIELFKEFLVTHSNTINNNDKKQTFGCKYEEGFSGETKDYHYIYTIIQSGIYGSSSEICDVVTNEVKYKKPANEAEVRPFYLFIIVPKDTDRVKVNKGMLIFQNVGPYGVKTITKNYIQEFFKQRFKITLKLSTISPELFINKVIKRDTIKQFIMVKNHMSGDTSDNVGKGYGVETRLLSNLHFNDSLWDIIFDKIRYVAKGKFHLFEFEQKEYDTLKLSVDIGGKLRTLDLHNLENLSIIEGIPDEIKMADGHPHKERLITHIETVANEYLSEMVLQIK